MRMLGIAALCAAVLVAAGCAYRVAETPTTPARAEGATSVSAAAGLRDADGRAVGSVKFTDTRNGLRIEGQFAGLPSGAHGIHVHAVGQCAAPEFASAGAHFNPDARHHGLESLEGPHAGDLPNLVIGDDGRGALLVFNPYLVLAPGAPNSLLKTGGTAIVVHRDPDDGKTDPAGNSGPRIACGVVTRLP